MSACPSGTVFLVRIIRERCPYISGTLSASYRNVVPDWQESSSLPRHRILVEWLGKHVDQVRDKRILHFAQEEQVKKWFDDNGIEYRTADLYKPADLKINIEDTGLDDDSYDVIICNHVIEHVDDYIKALKELRRIVSSNGMVIISFPVDLSYVHVVEDLSVTEKEDMVLKFGQADHKRVFGRDSRNILESVGFKVVDISGDDCSNIIKPVIGPADYDYNKLWCLTL